MLENCIKLNKLNNCRKNHWNNSCLQFQVGNNRMDIALTTNWENLSQIKILKHCLLKKIKVIIMQDYSIFLIAIAIRLRK
jgi:hypothetical protein